MVEDRQLTLPPHKIGDKGQRYAVVFKGMYADRPEDECALGYTDSPDGAERMANMVELHPTWN